MSNHTLQELAVKADNIIVSSSHSESDSTWTAAIDENFQHFFTLCDLPPFTVTYKKNSWPNASKLNGSCVTISRQEGPYMIVLLKDGEVSHCLPSTKRHPSCPKLKHTPQEFPVLPKHLASTDDDEDVDIDRGRPRSAQRASGASWRSPSPHALAGAAFSRTASAVEGPRRPPSAPPRRLASAQGSRSMLPAGDASGLDPIRRAASAAPPALAPAFPP